MAAARVAAGARAASAALVAVLPVPRAQALVARQAAAARRVPRAQALVARQAAAVRRVPHVQATVARHAATAMVHRAPMPLRRHRQAEVVRSTIATGTARAVATSVDTAVAHARQWVRLPVAPPHVAHALLMFKVDASPAPHRLAEALRWPPTVAPNAPQAHQEVPTHVPDVLALCRRRTALCIPPPISTTPIITASSTCAPSSGIPCRHALSFGPDSGSTATATGTTIT